MWLKTTKKLYIMKTKNFLKFTGVLLFSLILLSSCEKVKDNLSKEIEITPEAIQFTVDRRLTRPQAKSIENRSTDTYTNYYFGPLDTKINHYLEKAGFTYKNVRDFNFTSAEITLIAPENFNLKGLIGTKIYLNKSLQYYRATESTESNLVATAISASGKTLTFKINKANLMEYANAKSLGILIKGPKEPIYGALVNLKLQLKFKVKVSPLS